MVHWLPARTATPSWSITSATTRGSIMDRPISNEMIAPLSRALHVIFSELISGGAVWRSQGPLLVGVDWRRDRHFQ
jgi:hypothetical protein